MPSRICLLLTPMDVSLFRDGRPFDSESALARSQLPSPATTAGAIRTWLLTAAGVDLSKLRASMANGVDVAHAIRHLVSSQKPDYEWIVDLKLFGPLLHSVVTYYPLPMNVVMAPQSGWFLQAPLEPSAILPGYTSPAPGGSDAFRPVVAPCAEDLGNVEGFLNETELTGVLRQAAGNVPAPTSWRSDLYTYETRTGHALNSDASSTLTGLLYTAVMLRNAKYFVFRVDIQSDTRADLKDMVAPLVTKKPWVRLGGEGKVASVRLCDIALPCASTNGQRVTGKFTTYLATPGLFDGGNWYPKILASSCKLCGAVVGAPYLYQGWDVASKAPVPTRHGVRAGAIYFWDAGDSFVDDPHWKCISDRQDDCQAGWGLCLRGEWNYAG